MSALNVCWDEAENTVPPLERSTQSFFTHSLFWLVATMSLTKPCCGAASSDQQPAASGNGIPVDVLTFSRRATDQGWSSALPLLAIRVSDMPLLRRLHQERTRLSEEQASSTEATAEILGRLDFGDALRTSAHLNQPDTFKWLLSAGVPVRDEPGLLSELHVTAQYQLLKAFITARPSAAQGFGETMDFVVASETFETIQFFVSTKFGKWTPWAITEATMRGDLAILNILLDECVAVPPVGALKHAVSTRRLDIVKLLRPKCTSATILSGLLVAATSGNADIVEALLTEPMQGPYLPVLAAALANGHEFVAKVITGRLALHTADCYLLEAAKRNEARVVEFLMKRRFRAEEAAMVGTEQPFMREFMQRLVRDNYSKMVEDITRESAMRKCRW